MKDASLALLRVSLCKHFAHCEVRTVASCSHNRLHNTKCPLCIDFTNNPCVFADEDEG